MKKILKMILRSYRVIVGSWHLKRLKHFENLIEQEWSNLK